MSSSMVMACLACMVVCFYEIVGRAEGGRNMPGPSFLPPPSPEEAGKVLLRR